MLLFPTLITTSRAPQTQTMQCIQENSNQWCGILCEDFFSLLYVLKKKKHNIFLKKKTNLHVKAKSLKWITIPEN